MTINRTRIRTALKAFDFRALFVEELGWDHAPTTPVVVNIGDEQFTLKPVAHKRGMVAFVWDSESGANCPDYQTRQKLEREATKAAHEHLIIYCDRKRSTQLWQWVRREPGRPTASRQHSFQSSQSGEALIQKLADISFSLDEEESLTIAAVSRRVRRAFDVEKLTKRFYDRFRVEHGVFLKFIEGIQSEGDREWYASLMLNRLMFVYFVQKKGFLDGDTDYLRNRLRATQERKGKNQFFSFYRFFLLRLLHEGLGDDSRASELKELLGKVPYLNGGLFDVHLLERQYSKIEISDDAFEKLFDFFDAYQWHLDERPLRDDDEINPDVLGYIFEKYINQKQMGAYYTREDITEYIAKTCVIPYLIDASALGCPELLGPRGTAWNLLRERTDRYVYEPAKCGVDRPLPRSVEQGLTDLSKRGEWNLVAGNPNGLATETWREHINRRERCDKIQSIFGLDNHDHSVDELIANNLDIRQFAQDVIESCSKPSHLGAVYRCIEGMSVLDPTCGSGAFLFAALNVLEPLYEACLDRMQVFLDETGDSSDSDLAEFSAVLTKIKGHPNRRYFILKSIILNNLYGVDIMEEAVEICKLRLFLKLVAQISDVADIEPLPDIDFNIRAGNSLVGFATYDEVNRSVTRKFDFDNAMSRIEDNGQLANQAFRTFRDMQVRADTDAHGYGDAKVELGEKLEVLSSELNRFLADDYNVEIEDKAKVYAWRDTHRPFHWFVEFFGILESGGFNVIIGNPPYVEYKNVESYSVRGFRTEACGDLYSYVLERSLTLANKSARLGFIVPMSCFAVDKFGPLQRLFFEETSPLFITNWSGDAHPSRLFEGVDKRLEIVLGRKHAEERQEPDVYSSKYIKWYAEERPNLFRVAPVYQSLGTAKELMEFPSSVPKFGSALDLGALQAVRGNSRRVGMLASPRGAHPLYYTRKVSFFLQFLDFVPKVFDAQGKTREPSELKLLSFDSKVTRDLCLASLTSSLFYWYNIVNSDCRNLNKREIASFVVPNEVPSSTMASISKLLRKIMKCYDDSSSLRTVNYVGRGEITVQYFNFRPAKPLIDELDRVLLPLYGLSSEEVDFIINYEVKYRMGSDAEGADLEVAAGVGDQE